MRRHCRIRRRPPITGYAGQRLHALEFPLIAESTRSCNTAPAAAVHAGAVRGDGVVGEAQHQAAVAGVGDNQVGAASGHHHRGPALARRGNRRHEGAFVARLGEQVGLSADAEASVLGQRGAGGNR